MIDNSLRIGAAPSRNALLGIVAGCILLLAPLAASAQSGMGDTLTGVLAVDIRNGLEAPEEEGSIMFAGEEAAKKKSVLLAGVLSGVVPGAGQIYTEAPWWRAALYGTIEAAGWALYAIYNAKGNRATLDFQNYADAHWDVTRYIDWIAANYQSWSSNDVNKSAAAAALAAIYRSSDPSLPPWERVDFEQLNKLERAVTGGFSHVLPEHGEQQYYEEIGKYIQYRSGWDDHQAEVDTVIFDPSRVTPRNRDYVEQREHANDLGSYATTALGVVVLNHAVSMIDALLQARSYNVSIHSESRGMILPDGSSTIVTGIGMTIRF